MRLTLRTLLAYRDRVLKPNELDDMHRRVQQSPTAGKLLKRIEELASRKQILAPPVDGKGLGADANSIAEYLDDTLRKDQVPELERICLESDSQLAELAQCHNLLSTAMLTTVEVPQSLRDRVSSLADPDERERLISQRSFSAEELPAVRANVEPSKGSSSPWRVEEKVLRGDASQRNGSRADARSDSERGSSDNGVAQVDSDRKSKMVKAQAVEAPPMMASGGDSIRTTGLDLEGAQLAHEVPEYLKGRSGDGWRSLAVMTALVGLLLALTWFSIGSFDSVREMFAGKPKNGIRPQSLPTENGSDTKQDGDPNSNANGNANGNAAESNQQPGGVAAAGSSNSEASVPKDATGNGSAVSGAEQGSTVPAATPPMSSDKPSADSSAIKNPQPSATGTKPAPEPRAVATWNPADDAESRAMMFRQDATGSVKRVIGPTSLASGERIVVPLASRPTLNLPGGTQWQVCGPTIMALVENQDEVTDVQLQFGRAVVTASSSPQKLRLISPAGICLLSPAPSGRVAIDLSRQYIGPGSASGSIMDIPHLAITAIDGVLSCSNGDANAQPLQLAPGKSLLIIPGSGSSIELPSPPAWAAAESERPIDVQAADDLQKRLTGDVNAVQVMSELAAGRRPETAAAASIALAMNGQWGWAAAEKNLFTDLRARSHWPMTVEWMRQVLAANPKQLEGALDALSARDPSRKTVIMNLLIGYGPDLPAEAANQLIQSLESDVLLERVLAINQLVRLTGKDLGYQPAEVNQSAVQQWRRELAGGKLAPPAQQN